MHIKIRRQPLILRGSFIIILFGVLVCVRAQNVEETMTGKNVNKKQAVPSIYQLPLSQE